MAKSKLPPGFRFHPTDVELVWYYLKRKIMGKPLRFEAIAEIELYKFAPWDLPDKSQLYSKDLEWYFFCPRDRKYPNGSRANRTTESGHWKATGKDKAIIHNSSTIGMRKSLVFHEGKPPKGRRTDWVMYEYRLESKELVDAGISQDEYVICKIFQKSGSGPKIGEQYGAPFNEEDYDDDTTIEDFFSLRPESLDVQTTLLNPVTEQAMTSTLIETSSDPDFEIDGILLDEMLEFLNTSLLGEDAPHMIPDSAFSDVNVNETSSVDPEEIFTELENQYFQGLISSSNTSQDHFNETALNSMLLELEMEQYLELTDIWLTEDSDPYQSTMPTDASTSMHNNLVPVAELTNELPPLSIQAEDIGRSTHHPDVLESEFLPASFSYPFI